MYKSLFSDYEQYLTRRGVQNISAFHLTLQSFEKFCAVIIQDITTDNIEIETFEEDRSVKSFRDYRQLWKKWTWYLRSKYSLWLILFEKCSLSICNCLLLKIEFVFERSSPIVG